MQKIKGDKVLFFILIVFTNILLTIVIWDALGKSYIESYIKKNYGNAIEETAENSRLILDYKSNDNIRK